MYIHVVMIYDYGTLNYNFVGIMSFKLKFHARVILAPAPRCKASRSSKVLLITLSNHIDKKFT